MDHALPARRLFAGWTLVALAAAAQTIAMARLAGVADGAALVRALGVRLAILPLWVAITPLVLRSARRFPVLVERRPVAAHLALHVALGSLFVLLSNAVVRLPTFISAGADGPALATLARSTLLGVATYYPLAMVVYGAIVALGHPRGAAKSAGLPDESPVESPTPAPDAEHLPVRQWNRVHLVRLGEIDWIEAEDNYVVVHAAGRSYRGRERIGDIEARLDARRFVRIHRSTVVHVARIREVQPLTHGDHAVILHGGKVLRVARSRRAALEAALELVL